MEEVGLFLHLLQEQFLMQAFPLALQEQYFFKHFDVLQLQLRRLTLKFFLE